MKKTDLEKNKGLKIANDMKHAAAVRGGGGQGEKVVDRREQRRLDQAAGLVPFACKLDGKLAARLQELAKDHPGGINGLMGEVVTKGLGD
ncbi:hypothetical protein [Cupriavidus plantarum]|uniref:Uncharacterized protein n=1 Tax=Cupriavidus plantarum TaxID=942865 RepID=A0A316EXU8_9BURK|nr:hypothetical protein [Cupriavidus plantarum]NYH99628.1 hypothetical protein [Cupriavidus plantarum]PWK36832.1 hypothetical protein C7419_101699 [Cupriavidus plantarum]REF02428.1 hypothetical protein C7418_1237 [Cupriavidus plantarum]RLK44714.1 hypothetical protein C7417_0704 [Cupriavidus plantarum]CAG2151298.1 hypothetical protein LMG26296_04931 [Cupriavidus plantarum]